MLPVDLDAVGWGVAKGLVSQELVEQARDWLRQMSALDPVPSELEPTFEERPAGHPPVLRRLRRLLWSDPSFWVPWLHASGVTHLMREAIGSPAAIIFHAAFMKASGAGGPIRPHQDQVFWQERYARTFTWWVALDKSDMRNGCLELFPSTYHGDVLPHHHDPAYRSHRVLSASTEELGVGIPIEVEAGDVIMFDSHIVHMSRPNVSERSRRAISLVAVRTDQPNFSSADRFDL